MRSTQGPYYLSAENEQAKREREKKFREKPCGLRDGLNETWLILLDSRHHFIAIPYGSHMLGKREKCGLQKMLRDSIT